MAEEIVNKHIIFKFMYEKKTTQKICQNFMVVGVKMAESFKKNTKNPIFKNSKKAPRIRKNSNL